MPTLGDRPEFILKAVQSILDQDFADFELIIKDGIKNQSLVSILPKDPRIVYIREEDSGLGNALNQGFSIAKGDIFNESNDDDLMAPGTLKLIDEQMGRHNWVYGNIQFSDGRLMGAPFDYEALKRGNYIPQPAVFFSKEAWKLAGQWDEIHNFASDYEYWLRLGGMFKPKYIDAILAFYTSHPGQITAKHLEKQLSDAREVQEKYI